MERLKQLRTEKGLYQKDIATYLGVDRTTYVKYENGSSEPSNEILSKLADYFGVTTDYLLGREEKSATLADSIDALISKHPGLFRPKMKKVPILGGIACGKAIFSPNLDEEFALVNEDIDADCALVCKGDSMIDVGINDGDVVYIRQQEMVENGQIAAVVIGDEITLKRVFYYRDKNKLVLHPANPNYEPFVYTGPELDEIHILGRAVAQLRRIK